ncbi:MAG: tetratricopeptide repeat protein, partial [Comamonadaceae bacterium]
VQADRQIVEGETAQAVATLQAGLSRWPGAPELRAQLARAQLLGDRVEESARTLGEPRADDPASIWLARGALARRQGDAPGTLGAYGRATQLAPQDDRGWFGLGSAHTEREDSGPARSNLLRALELHPTGPGYRGELGTLETYRNKLADADAAFAAALADNPGDYVALTGLGLLRLKQGDAQAALDAFLRAGVMEPRYARAKTYTAVAYYQLGRHQDAIATLQQAAALDDKDPVPHLFLAQVYTDLFRAGDAVAASRAGVQRLPYLKSLNQLANDQQGRANFGAALAFFGMEDWALELAQQAYLPYWGGSHLFLADRYPGEFNKNSELFQGFLADPLAFGASPLFSSLLQRPGMHGAVSMTGEKEFYRLSSPAFTLNGLQNVPFPVAFFVKGQKAIASRLPIDVGVSGLAALYDPTGRADARASVATLGLGARPIDRLGLFAYYNDTDIRIHGRNRIDLFGGDTISSEIDNN